MILNKTHAALAVWASARHHAAHGGTGLPPLDEITNDPAPSEGEGLATESGAYYEATMSKYRERPPAEMDHDVLSAIEVVERALRRCAAPRWFVAYLLFRHPDVGRFMPERRVDPTCDPEDAPSAFVRSGHMPPVKSQELRRSQVAQLRRMERAFNRRLARELANLPDSAPAARARCARSDSPEPP